MAAKMITLLSPAGRRPSRKLRSMPAGRAERRVLGFLSNHKLHASRLQQDLAAYIPALFPGLQLRFYEKPGAALGAPVELLARIKAECGLVVTGHGD